MCQGVVHKRRSQPGEFVQFGHFADKGGFQMRTSALFSAKNSKFYGVSARTTREELSQCGQFADKGEGLIFRDFVRHLLWTAPKTLLCY